MSLYDQMGPDPFSTDAIKTLPYLSLESITTWEGFRFNNSLESGLLRLNDVNTKHLPNLKPDVFLLDLQDVSLPDLSSPSSSSSESGQEPQQSQDERDDIDGTPDLWILPEIMRARPKDSVVSWDIFLNKSHKEPPTPYISEANPRVFSTILQSSDRDLLSKPIKPDALLHAAFELATGRGSTLFQWIEEEERFSHCWGKIAACGYSVPLLHNFFEDLLRIGTYTRKLNNCFDGLENQSQQLTPSRIAFIAASRTALHATQNYLETLRPTIVSLLQLKDTMCRVAALVATLKEFVDAIHSCQTDPAIVLALMRQAANASLCHSAIDGVIQQIISRTLRPLLTKLLHEVALTPSETNGHGKQCSDKEHEVDIWSSVLPPYLCQTVTETRQSLGILRSFADDYSVLSSVCSSASYFMGLEPGFTFDDICQLQSQSIAYEDAMKTSFLSRELSASTSSLSHSTSASLRLEETGTTGPNLADPFHLELGLFDHHVPVLDLDKADGLYSNVIAYLDNPEAEKSPFQLDYMEVVTLSVTPLVSAQHRLLSYSVLRLLFQKHQLLSHLNLQRGFQLLGDGPFSARLSMALFDSDQNSSEGQRPSGGSTGLRLQTRDTWPPAGSELRLVLMGILSDSLANSKDQFLDDTISFAIRDMPVEELEKCRDVDSIHALDFLRLEYKPPNELLQTVLTPRILDKYDRLFQHLLRLSRIHSLTQTLLRQNFDHLPSRTGTRSDHRMIVQMHHFTSTLADYCHNVAINVCWKKFEGTLHDVERHINNNDYERTLQLVKSQDYLRALHENTLDKLLHALLLKRNQSGTRQILEDVFTLILRVAAQETPSQRHNRSSLKVMTRADEQRMKDDVHETTTNHNPRKGYDIGTDTIAKEFQAKVMQFIDALRVQGVSSKHSQSRADGNNTPHEFIEDSDDENLFEHLLLRLDMFGYWGQGQNDGRGVFGAS
ncbi:hypothetical protein A1O3_02083 [Capronia epimyces CBS 606.96]|uniref:Spindle pole body component n=1 Tax=Capronia epimyces CBS 606.96 TaxID=1182542 RepID=W9Z3E3_9EURO|nr:uncharacterized protein A1O3_02083 [Capronia epimyces CBS 606.96]EXJ89019.1 hypothetical protein A1O3_02083 [Capronia epimyces CBS 606.96]